MNHSDEPEQDRSDDVLDRAIRLVKARQSPAEVMHRVIETAAAFATAGQPIVGFRSAKASVAFAERKTTFRRAWLVLAAAVATAAACAVGFLMLPAPAVGWAEVTAAVNSQKWIQVTFAYSDGTQAMSWLSPQLKVSAFHTDRHAWFYDGKNGVKYIYHMYSGQGEKIAKLLLRDSEAEQTLPVDFMAGGSWSFLGENVVSQKRREVREGGKRWIEFDVLFWRGEDRAGTLRVDPETRLPVYLKKKTNTFTFHYPTDGPADIYALGVLASVGINDLVPSEDCQKVLRAMAASRARIGNFRLVATEQPQPYGLIVWRKGDQWRVDYCHGGRFGPAQLQSDLPPDGLGWTDPVAVKLGLFWAGPLYVCDGRAVYSNKNPSNPGPADWKLAALYITPRTLLSGDSEGQLGGALFARFAERVFPDLMPRYGWGFEFDPKPTDAPGCVLIKRSAEIGDGATGNEWYYIDPTKGCAVVRVEMFNLPAGAKPGSKPPTDRQTTRMEDFQLSPQGFWYPRTIREKNGRRQTEVHYHFDFDPVLPDNFFDVDLGKK